MLSKIHLITSGNELKDALVAIDKENISKAKKREKKLVLLKIQIKIRKKILNQKIHNIIVFSHCRKQRPVHDIAKELFTFIAKDDCPITKYIQNPTLLVGSQIKHKFEIAETGKETFFGSVISYDSINKLHEIKYDDEQENCYFDLTQDVIMGDLIIM